MDEFMWWVNWVNKIREDQLKKETVKKVATAWWVKPHQVTAEMLQRWWITNIPYYMQWVCMWICEFYWLSLWELQMGSQEEIINRYWIKQEELNTLLDYWDIWLAYSEYVKRNLWDKPKSWEAASLEVIKPEAWHDEWATNAVMQKMRADEKSRLQALIDNETDQEKKEMYEAQMKVLNIKEKNWWNE